MDNGVRGRGRTLTAGQLQLLKLAADDRSLVEVSRELGVSSSHVYNEVQAIKVKLDVSTLHGALLRAHTLGLLDRRA